MLKMVLINVLVICLFTICVISVRCRPSDSDHDMQPHSEDKVIGKGPGEPLFLTSYIEQGRLREGREKAAVDRLVGKGKSYAGYLTVDKRYNSNMFFWYFESENDPKSDPTVVWLQGGPGCSSLFGLFIENGPYIVGKHKKVSTRKHTWSAVSNLIYLDNPVGTGYSFTENDLGYTTNQTKVGADLYEALVQLLKLFPRIQKNSLYLTGESYAGKYIPALGRTIHLKNQDHPDVYVNLEGLMIGNGFTDPMHMLIYSEYLYQNGLIDHNAKDKLHKKEHQIIKYIKQQQWHRATDLFEQLIDGDGSLYFKYTGLTSYYNYYNTDSGNWYDYHQDFVTSDFFRRLVHVGNKNYSDGSVVFEKLYDDMSKSVIDWVADLLNDYRVLFYNGQLDVICAYPLTVNYLRNMKWPLSHEYKVAKRHRYVINKTIAGYYKSVGNLTEVLVRDAGHLVPADQPYWSLRLLKDFIHNNIIPNTGEHENNFEGTNINRFPGFQ